MATNNSINSNFPATPALPANGGTGLSSPTVHGIMVAEGSSNMNPIVLTNGQLLIGSTGADPVAANLSAGSGISIVNGAGSITISSSGNTPWTEVTGTSQSMAINNGYVANNASLVTLTLPATAAVGDELMIVGKGAGGWLLAQNSGQTVYFGTATTTSGVGGSLASTNRRDCIKLICITANTEFEVVNAVGNITFV